MNGVLRRRTTAANLGLHDIGWMHGQLLTSGLTCNASSAGSEVSFPSLLLAIRVLTEVNRESISDGSAEMSRH